MKDKMLEEICTFAQECALSNYGSLEVCKEDYINCIFYQKYIAKKLEEYNKERK